MFGRASFFGFVDCAYSNTDIDNLVTNFIEFLKTVSRCGLLKKDASEVHTMCRYSYCFKAHVWSASRNHRTEKKRNRQDNENHIINTFF